MLCVVLLPAGKEYMGRKDIGDKEYFSDSRRFAELINYVVYQGKKTVLPENLVLQRRKYPSVSSPGGELERDVLMKDVSQGICYGIELETESDYSMPERVIIYDACEYEYQVKELAKGHRSRRDYADYREKKSRMKEGDKLFPMITVVLYLGEGRWKGKMKLSQMCGMSMELSSLLRGKFCDYGFLLAEADYVNAEACHTDLKEFFQALQCRKDRERLKALFQAEQFQYLDTETEQAIARHLHITRLLHKMEKEGLSMCKAFQDLMKEERQDGRREGKRDGRREDKREGKREEKLIIISRMIKGGCDENFISKMTNCTKEEYAAAVKRN